LLKNDYGFHKVQWANLQAVDIQFSQDFRYQLILDRVIQKNLKDGHFETVYCAVTLPSARIAYAAAAASLYRPLQQVRRPCRPTAPPPS